MNGYVDEMVDGQKVDRVFRHEGEAMRGFRAVNERLRESAFQANYFGNLVMPVNASLGNLSYALVSFMPLNRSFTQPITQISQQVSFVTMTTAGAERVFVFMDERPEEDGGHT